MEKLKLKEIRNRSKRNSLIEKMLNQRVGLKSKKLNESLKLFGGRKKSVSLDEKDLTKNLDAQKNKKQNIIEMIKTNILRKKLEKVDKETKFEANIKSKFLGLHTYIDAKELISDLNPFKKRILTEKLKNIQELANFKELSKNLFQKLQSENSQLKKKNSILNLSQKSIPKIILNPMLLENRASIIDLDAFKRRSVMRNNPRQNLNFSRTSLGKISSLKRISNSYTKLENSQNNPTINTTDIADFIRSSEFEDDNTKIYEDQLMIENKRFLSYLENVDKKADKSLKQEETNKEKNYYIHIQNINNAIREIMKIKVVENTGEEYISKEYNKFIENCDNVISEIKNRSKNIYKGNLKKYNRELNVKNENSSFSTKIKENYLPSKLFVTEFKSIDGSKESRRFPIMIKKGFKSSNLKTESNDTHSINSNNFNSRNLNSTYSEKLEGILNDAFEFSNDHNDSVIQLKNIKTRTKNSYNYFESKLKINIESLNTFDKKKNSEGMLSARSISLKKLKNQIM